MQIVTAPAKAETTAVAISRELGSNYAASAESANYPFRTAGRASGQGMAHGKMCRTVWRVPPGPKGENGCLKNNLLRMCCFICMVFLKASGDSHVSPLRQSPGQGTELEGDALFCIFWHFVFRIFCACIS